MAEPSRTKSLPVDGTVLLSTLTKSTKMVVLRVVPSHTVRSDGVKLSLTDWYNDRQESNYFNLQN